MQSKMSAGKAEKSEWNTNILMGSEINIAHNTTATGEGTFFFFFFFAKGTRETRNCTM